MSTDPALYAAGDRVVAARNLAGPARMTDIPAGAPGRVISVDHGRPFPLRVLFDGTSVPWRIKPDEIRPGGDR